MRIGNILILSLCVILAFSSMMFLQSVRAVASSDVSVFADPLTVQATDVDQNFVVNINVSDVVDLYAWQTGIMFNPEVLNCTGFYEGEFLKRSGEPTLFLSHYKGIDNALGIVYYRGATIMGPISGISGNGQLAYATFTSVGVGISDFHLTDVMLVDSKVEQIAFEVKESLTVTLSGMNYCVAIVDNLAGENSPVNPPSSGVSSAAFNVGEKEISFDAVSVKPWSCELSVPKALLSSDLPTEWSVKMEGASVPYTTTENDTHTSLYFGNAEGNYTVEVVGTKVASAHRAGDINRDGKIDIFDAVLLGDAFGSSPSKPDTWNPDADCNSDGVVDIFDAIIVAVNFNLP